MKDVTVADVLKLPIFSGAILKAGHGGLRNPIQYVNVLDNLMEESELCANIRKSNQSFYITSMYYGKDDPAYIMKVLQYFIRIQAAAVCIIDENMSDLPEDAYAFADAHNFPVLFIDNETPYSIMISSIMELKLSYQRLKENEDLLLLLTNREVSEARKAEIIQTLNPRFANNVIAFHCAGEGSRAKNAKPVSETLSLIEKINCNVLSFASEYREGILIVYSYKDSGTRSVRAQTDDLLHTIRGSLPDDVVGVSDPCPLYDLGQAISQAFTSSRAGAHTKSATVYFSKLGVTRLLLEFEGHPQLDAFYSDTAGPILEYDSRYNSHLMETVNAFIEHNMDYVKTSRAMYVHENTIRYRLNRIKELIPYGQNDTDFYQTLYILYKIKRIKAF